MRAVRRCKGSVGAGRGGAAGRTLFGKELFQAIPQLPLLGPGLQKGGDCRAGRGRRGWRGGGGRRRGHGQGGAGLRGQQAAEPSPLDPPPPGREFGRPNRLGAAAAATVRQRKTTAASSRHVVGAQRSGPRGSCTGPLPDHNPSARRPGSPPSAPPPSPAPSPALTRAATCSCVHPPPEPPLGDGSAIGRPPRPVEENAQRWGGSAARLPALDASPRPQQGRTVRGSAIRPRSRLLPPRQHASAALGAPGSRAPHSQGLSSPSSPQPPIHNSGCQDYRLVNEMGCSRALGWQQRRGARGTQRSGIISGHRNTGFAQGQAGTIE